MLHPVRRLPGMGATMDVRSVALVSGVKLAIGREMDMNIATGTARAILGRRSAATHGIHSPAGAHRAPAAGEPEVSPLCVSTYCSKGFDYFQILYESQRAHSNLIFCVKMTNNPSLGSETTDHHIFICEHVHHGLLNLWSGEAELAIQASAPLLGLEVTLSMPARISMRLLWLPWPVCLLALAQAALLTNHPEIYGSWRHAGHYIEEKWLALLHV
jgi:hypothetical protein